jgi:hypothetical protein
VKSGGGILLGDLNVKNKELRPELKDDTDFFALFCPGDFLCGFLILRRHFSESKPVKEQNQVFMHSHPFYGWGLHRGDSKGQDGSFKSLLLD